MEHYYTPPKYISESNLTITNDEVKHLSKVLRKESGSEIFVTDGIGNLYKCVISAIKKNEIICTITGKQNNINESPIKLTAYISLLKNPSRFEFAIEKLTELGVYEIQPLITDRVISKKKDKSGRWQSIALSAMKQSQRCRLPQVNRPVDFEDAIKSCKSIMKLIAHEKSLTPLPAPMLWQAGQPPLHPRQNHSRAGIERGSKSIQSISLFIGPEGGFSDEEIKLANDYGFQLLSLGNRKYRSETAAIAAAALILINIEN
ncbi:MAG TPA: RsmE family RNA methyltransferase [Ignavibacteria bacterium]|jgi:16S rRNA (uracil1498-N3)-methyltransferase